jgi:hypothetical protein
MEAFILVLWLVHLNGRGKKLEEARNRAGGRTGKGNWKGNTEEEWKRDQGNGKGIEKRAWEAERKVDLEQEQESEPGRGEEIVSIAVSLVNIPLAGID